jgi:hypothetical protein
MMRSLQKLEKCMVKLEAKFANFAGTEKTKKEMWTCSACRCETCFASRSVCFKCGQPRVPKPPGLGGQPAACPPSLAVEEAESVPMETEVEESLEELISEQEELLKFLKGKESSFAKGQRAQAESKLKDLRDRQRQSKPLPVRLQAATDRFAKAQQVVEEQKLKVASVCEALKAAKKELEEAEEKRKVALQELEEVKKAAGAAPVVEAEKGLTGSLVQALAARNIVGADAECLIAEVLAMYLRAKQGAASSQAPPASQVVPEKPREEVPVTVAPVRWPEGKGGRPVVREIERYGSRESREPRESSSSRSPRGRWQEEY